jgi:transposase-like protein
MTTGPRWTARRKADVVEAVRSGRITLDEACRRYALSVEELTGWEKALDRYGSPGLRVTRLQVYRETEPGAPKRAKPRRYAACNHG